MFKAQVRFALLALLLTLLLNATYILKDDILKPEASKMVEEMGSELSSKTGINVYLIATKEPFKEGFNLVSYSKKFEKSIRKPYVLLIFAPYAVISEKSKQKGRVGFIPSSNEVRKLYDYDDVRAATVDIVAIKDKNSQEDKHNIGIVQGYSELADQIADSKGVELTKTLPNETTYIIVALKVLVYIGSVLVLWMFIFRFWTIAAFFELYLGYVLVKNISKK